MPYTPITSLPTAPDRTQPSTFSTRADAFVAALDTFVTETNASGTYIDGVGTAVDADATAAAASASAASTSATEAAASATAAALEAAEWSSGASYTEGDVVWSGVDYGTYRAKTTHSGETTDPSSDTTNWALVAVNDLAALGVTASASELNILDGVTATSAELNILDGVTATTAELNILDGITATTAELNILDGVTATAAELNILDGVTATGAELNYLDITTLGTSEASKAVTADANGVVEFADGINEGFTSVTSTSNATTVDCRDGNVFAHTLTENTTFTFSNPPTSGTAYGFMLKLVQDSTARTVTWPASVDWIAASAPVISTGSGDVDIFIFITHDGGSNWYGFTAGQDFG